MPDVSVTQRERDAQWWRNLARDYERRTKRVRCSWPYDAEHIPICGIFDPGGWRPNETFLWPAEKRRFKQMQGVGRTGYVEWWESASPDDAFDLRATACCLIAAMVEAGDA